jgi:glycosyltransferase involved in cell wall biosynthesis
MDVCHITTVHPVQDARIYHRMCGALAARKLDVVLIAPGSFPAQAHLRPSNANDRLTRAGRLRRSAIALRAALAEDADVYHFHDPELIPMALLLKALRPSAAVVYDVHEDYPSMMRDKYWLPRWSRPAVAAGAGLANRIAATCLDGIVVADQGVARDFAKPAAKKTLIHYNFPALGLFAADNRAASQPTADLVYVGGLSERAGVFVLFDALKILAEQAIRPTVRLAGYTDGEAGLATVTGALRRYGLDGQVQFVGRIPHSQVPAWLRQGRIGLVLLQAVPKFLKNIPSKMFEYWASGLPVLASDLPPIRQFLVEGRNGYLFPPASPAHLADRIAYLLQHPGERESLGRAGREMIEAQWNNEKQIESLIGFYGNLLGKRSRATGRAPTRHVRIARATKESPADLMEP